MSNCAATSKDGVHNCFGAFACELCYGCCYRDGAIAEGGKSHFVSYLDKVTELFEYLKQTESPESAFSTIHFLQEHMRVLPSCIERCEACNNLFDTDSEGYYLDDEHELIDYETDKATPLPEEMYGHWCSDECVPGNDDFRLKETRKE